MTPYRVAAFLFVVYSFVPSVAAQYNCDKYCHASCSDYFPGGEFSSCVEANVHCSCHTKISAKNPLLIFILVAGFFVGLFLCGMCYRLCQYSDMNRPVLQRPVAYPVPVAVARAVAGNNNRRSNINITVGSANTHNTSQRNTMGGYVNPLAPQSSGDVPPEYMAPPPYNECVINVDPQEKSEKILT